MRIPWWGKPPVYWFEVVGIKIGYQLDTTILLHLVRDVAIFLVLKLYLQPQEALVLVLWGTFWFELGQRFFDVLDWGVPATVICLLTLV